MPIFNTSNFERQGNTENDQHLETTEDVCSAIINISEMTLRSIKIFTPDLEHLLYNNEALRKNILNFARGNRHAQIQILVNNTEAAIRLGHRLIGLSQQLTSAMKIKNTPEEYQVPMISFVLFDQQKFIYKTDCTKQAAVMSVCKYRSEKLNNFFTLAWEHTELSVEHLRFYI